MLERVMVYFFAEPRRLENLGRTLVSIGATIILSGLLGHVAVTAIGAVSGLTGQANTVKTLAEIYPSLPTWWIPERILGALPAILAVAIGSWLNLTGKELRRFLEH